MDDDVRRFLNTFFEFYDTARSNIGYDDNQFNAVRESLLALKPRVQATGVVPIQAANVFVDLFGAIESASYRHDQETAQKLREYFAAGVRLVWVADPQRRTVTAYRRGTPPQRAGHPAARTHPWGPARE